MKHCVCETGQPQIVSILWKLWNFANPQWVLHFQFSQVPFALIWIVFLLLWWIDSHSSPAT